MIRQNGLEETCQSVRSHKYFRSSDGKLVSDYSGSGVYWTDNRQYINWDGTKRKGKRKLTRSCYHVVVQRALTRYNASYYTSGIRNYYYETSDYYAPRIVLDTLPDLSSVHSEALQFFKAGCVERSVDIITNLIEARQILTSFDFLEKKVKTLLDAAKCAANAHLSWSFGIKPLLQDVASLRDALGNISSHISWLRKHEGKPVKVKFSKDVSDITRPSNEYTYWATGTSLHEIVSWKANYTAYALIVYDVAPLSDAELTARYLFRALGADDPLGIIWEGISYSFVLDWLFKVGDFLSTLAPKVQLPYRIIDSGWTLKTHSCRDYSIKYNWPKETDQVWTARDSVRTFRRHPGIPVAISSVNLGDPGLSQLALAISLSVQKIRHK